MDLASVFSQEANIILLFIVSFVGGLIASVSPCSLSMLPLIIGYVGGYSKEKTSTTLVQMLFFVLGTAIVFSCIGIICAITGKVFVTSPFFALIVASVLMIMGLKLVGFLDFELPVLIKEMPQNKTNSRILYPIFLGAVFALIGTPCSTPILAGIMAFATLSANIVNSIIMLFLFALGQGLIIILAGVLTSKIKNMQNFYKFSDILMKICGILLILVSIYIFYKIFNPLLVN